jgi:hypothetical protein
MRPNGSRSGFPEDRASENESARLTRKTLLASVCRDCAVFEAVLIAHISKNFVRAAVPRTKPIIRAQTQNYNFSIGAAHISIAKFG